MNKKEFDELIKNNINKDGDFGYIVNGVNKNDLYYNNLAFDEFVNGMKTQYSYIYDSYYKGKGSELREVNGKSPKMASVASSSRFCYLALRNASIKDFDYEDNSNGLWTFEKDLPAKGISGTHPQMDAFIEGESVAYYFEFKCHEMFDKHNTTISRQYDSFLSKWSVNRASDEIPVKEFGLTEIGLFDLKQFITHLTGITSHDVKNKKKIFSYVYFKPDNCNDIIFEDLKKEIKAIFNAEKVKIICRDNNIELRLYYYENSIMDGFEKKNPTRIL